MLSMQHGALSATELFHSRRAYGSLRPGPVSYFTHGCAQRTRFKGLYEQRVWTASFAGLRSRRGVSVQCSIDMSRQQGGLRRNQARV